MRGPTRRLNPLVGLILLACLAACSCGEGGGEPTTAAPVVEPDRTFVVLGFDGVDPDLLEQMWSEGELPALKALADQGTFARLRSTVPPQSPVAWATFATGTLPGSHGVFDFIVRDPATYWPKMGAVEYFPPEFDAYGQPKGGQEGRNVRRGDPFWVTASQAGVEVRVIDVPYSWPPERVPLGGVASGLGVPDLIGTNSTSTFFSTDYPEPPPSFGGVRAVPLDLRDGGAQATIEGPKRASGARSQAPVAFALKAHRPGVLEITTSTAALEVAEGGWSEWIVVDLPVGRATAKGQVRFHVAAARPERVHVYMSPVCSDPLDPWVQLSWPEELARELMRTAGRYKTVGWEEDTQALNTEQMGEDAWLEHVYAVMDQRTAMALAALEAGPPPLFVSAWTATDRVAHLFWRLRNPASPRYDAELAAKHGDAVERVYRKMDTIVADVVARLPEDAVLVILSDHGFHAFDRGLHVNRWLAENGYLALKDGGTSLADADWSASRAYSLGTGQVYLNLQGREGKGTVAFGQERAELLGEIRGKLLALEDPASGEKVFRDVVLGAEIYSGSGAALAPDLQLAYADGYQSSWATKLGGAPPELFEDNPRKWSGDHAASWAGDTEGVLFVNRKLELGEGSPGIEDLAPTILAGLGLDVPEQMDGAPLPLP